MKRPGIALSVLMIAAILLSALAVAEESPIEVEAAYAEEVAVADPVDEVLAELPAVELGGEGGRGGRAARQGILCRRQQVPVQR